MMSAHSQEIDEQNKLYRESLLQDIEKSNQQIEELMNITVMHEQEEYIKKKHEAMNNMTPQDRRRLMTHEDTLENILNLKEPNSESGYYNTSREAARSILPQDRFEYDIGEHRLIYEMKDLMLNTDTKTVNIPIVVWEENTSDWKEKNYTIINDDVWIIAEAYNKQLKNNANPQLPHSPPHSPPHSSPHSSHSPHSLIKSDYERTEKQVRKLQDRLFENVLSALNLQNNSNCDMEKIGKQIYSLEIYEYIKYAINDNVFPFQIINNLTQQLIQ